MGKKKDKNDEEENRGLIKVASFLVSVASVIMLAMGICVIVYGYHKFAGEYMRNDSKEQDEEQQHEGLGYGNPKIYAKTGKFLPDFEGWNMSKNIFAELSLFGGCFTILTGLLGLAAVSWRKPYFTCPFATMSLIMGIVLILAGVLKLEFGRISGTILERMCDEFANQTDYIQAQYRENIDVYMCSPQCPCWSGFVERQAKVFVEDPESITEDTVKAIKEEEQIVEPDFSAATHRNRVLWTGYMGASEGHLNKFNRTRGEKFVDDPNNPGVKFIPMIWKDYKYDQDGKQISFSSFQECLNQVLIPGQIITKGKSRDQQDEARKFYEDDGLFTYLTQLEKDYRCSSICQPNLFYITKDLSEGRPVQECILATADTWINTKSLENYGMIGAIMAFVTGSILILSMMCSCPLCGGFGDNHRRDKMYKYKDNYQ